MGARRASRSTSARRGEVLDAIDLAFERTWGERFEPLREAPGSRAREPRTSPSVDLLVVDRAKRSWEDLVAREPDPFGEPMHAAPIWRAAEARLLAKRVDELTRYGPWSYGDVVMLFRATTAMGLFERALDERGIPVHVVGGRGYWGQQQVMDLRHWLAALANPLDELAVYSVLASPLAGLSLDGVALIGLRARRLKRDPWWALTAALGRGGGEPDPELLEQLPAARPAPPRRVCGPLRGRAQDRRPGAARDPDRPGRHRAPTTTSMCWRSPAPRAGWRTCAS